MKHNAIKVTRCLGAVMSMTEMGGWQVSYVYRQFQTREAATIEAQRLQTTPTATEAKAMREGRFVDEPER
jgi:hypothetical protein